MKRPHVEMLNFARRVLNLKKSIPLRLTLLSRGGSHRSFYRLFWEKNCTAIFMHYDLTREENNYYAEIAAFLHNMNIPAPQIMAHDSVRGFIIMEDLGDVDLWSLRDLPWQERRPYYMATLSIIQRLHTLPRKSLPGPEVRLMGGFGEELYRWEHNYFLENFVRAVCGRELNDINCADLTAELSALSTSLAQIRQCLVHRDLQSRNIMIHQNKPVLIDFQGMRFGNPYYDLGSLLYDPYVILTERERKELLRYYFLLTEKENLLVQQQNKNSEKWDVFLETFLEASAQRLMQALGAYGFLGLKQNLPDFLTHIPQAIENLIDASTHARRLPLLHNLALECQELLQKRQSVR